LNVADDAAQRSDRSGGFTDKEPAKRRAAAVAEGEPPYTFHGGSSEYATLRVIRQTWGGMLVSFSVELDGCFIGPLNYGGSLEVRISPGEHLLSVWGGGAFFGATERFVAVPDELSEFTVCYSWYGGVSVSRVW
jgi:hypothetical protein